MESDNKKGTDNKQQPNQTIGSEDNNDKQDANTGDWNDMRGKSDTKEKGYNDDSNDNSGGAGSTGSAATNSGE